MPEYFYGENKKNVADHEEIRTVMHLLAKIFSSDPKGDSSKRNALMNDVESVYLDMLKVNQRYPGEDLRGLLTMIKAEACDRYPMLSDEIERRMVFDNIWSSMTEELKLGRYSYARKKDKPRPCPYPSGSQEEKGEG